MAIARSASFEQRERRQLYIGIPTRIGLGGPLHNMLYPTPDEDESAWPKSSKRQNFIRGCYVRLQIRFGDRVPQGGLFMAALHQGLVSGAFSRITSATTAPEKKVNTAIAAIAQAIPKTSAMMPAESAPMA